MHHAALAAYLGGAFGFLTFAWIGVDTGEWGEVARFVVGSALTIVLGVAVDRWRSQLAAGTLFVVAAGTLIWRVVQTHRPGSLIGFLVIAVYLRGFLASMDYAEVAKPDADDTSLAT